MNMDTHSNPSNAPTPEDSSPLRTSYDDAVEMDEVAKDAYDAHLPLPTNSSDEAKSEWQAEEERLVGVANAASDALDQARELLAESDEPRDYTFRDGGGGSDSWCGRPSEVEDAWHEWMSHGDWGDDNTETTWQRGYADDEFGTTHTYRYEITPDAPECSEDDHEWKSPYSVLGGLKENPGVWSHGGGVVIKEVCRHCGMYRETDTWAQDMETGEQGLESVTYSESDEDSRDYLERLAADRDRDKRASN